jgi:hypothetical protein
MAHMKPTSVRALDSGALSLRRQAQTAAPVAPAAAMGRRKMSARVVDLVAISRSLRQPGSSCLPSGDGVPVAASAALPVRAAAQTDIGPVGTLAILRSRLTVLAQNRSAGVDRDDRHRLPDPA